MSQSDLFAHRKKSGTKKNKNQTGMAGHKAIYVTARRVISTNEHKGFTETLFFSASLDRVNTGG